MTEDYRKATSLNIKAEILNNRFGALGIAVFKCYILNLNLLVHKSVFLPNSSVSAGQYDISFGNPQSDFIG